MSDIKWVHARGFDVMVAISVKTKCITRYSGYYECPVHGSSCLYSIETEPTEDRMLKRVESAVGFHIKEVHKL